MFKPSTDSAGLVVSSQKKFSVLGLGSLGGAWQVGVFSRFYCLFAQPWTPIEWAHVLAQIFLWSKAISRVFRALIGFLAYLDEKLCHKNQKVVKNPTPKKGNQGGMTPLFDIAITRCQNRLESCSNPLKIREDKQFRLKKKIFSLRSRVFC